MKKKWMARFAVFMFLICIIPDTLVFAQRNFSIGGTRFYTTEAYTMNKKNETVKMTMQVEKGAKNFYIGEYVLVKINNNYDQQWAFKLTEITYTSSNQDVASVNTDGLVTMHKTGKTNIRLSYKGMKLTIPVEVVSSMKCKKPPVYKERLRRARELNKIHGEGRIKVTKQNRHKLLNALAWSSEMQELDEKYRWSEVGDTYFPEAFYYDEQTKNTLYCFPEFRHASRIEHAVRNEVEAAAKKEKKRRVKGISGSGKDMTITWNKNLTEDALFAMRIQYSQGAEIKEKDTFSFRIQILDLDTGNEYNGTAYPQIGKKTMKVRLDHYKLKKGNTYYLTVPLGDSTYGNGNYGPFNVTQWFEEGKQTFVAK